MMSHGSESRRSDDAAAPAGPSGLTPKHKAALSQATDMIAQGHSQEAAVDHLVAHDMPSVVAKVLVKQLERNRAG